MATKSQNNVKRGYDLAAEALYHIADKLSSIRENDDKLKVKNELTKQGLDLSVEDLRQKAKRLRDSYQKANKPQPPRGSKEYEDYSLSRRNDDSFAKSNKELICFALRVYSDDLVRTRQDIPRQLIMREPTPGQIQSFLKMDAVEKQLKFIEDAMQKDWCEKY